MYLSLQPARERHLLLFNTVERQLISLNQETYTIGRCSKNTIVIEGDPISRVHARLLSSAQGSEETKQYIFLDGASDEKLSKNGIFVNGSRCNHHPLLDGDILTFANVVQAAYFKKVLSDSDFKQLQASLICDQFFFGIFHDYPRNSEVRADLSNLEFTTILLGESPVRAKETISIER